MLYSQTTFFFLLNVQEERQEKIIQKLRDKVEQGVKIVEIKEKGKGLVSTKEFKVGELICEFTGEHISLAEAKKRETNTVKMQK